MKFINFKKPYIILWAFAIFAFFFSYYNANMSIAMDIHDSYFMISHFYLNLALSIVFAITGLIYFLLFYFGRKPKKTITNIHLAVSILFYIIVILNSLFHTTPEHNFIDLAITLFVIAQLIFSINLIYTFISGSKANP